MEVFIAGEILEIDQPVGTLPELARNVARRLAGQALGFSAADRLHIDVHAPFIRLHEGKRLAIGGNTKKSPLRMTEKIADGNRCIRSRERWNRGDHTEAAEHK